MSDQLRFGLIGTGWIGRFHAETLAHRLPDATLVAVADPEYRSSTVDRRTAGVRRSATS